jgi:hypothetical protein
MTSVAVRNCAERVVPFTSDLILPAISSPASVRMNMGVAPVSGVLSYRTAVRSSFSYCCW